MSHTCLCLPSIDGTHLPTPEGWKAELAWVAGYAVRQFQWLKWSCEAGGSPDEARLKQTKYPFHTKLIWRYLGIK